MEDTINRCPVGLVFTKTPKKWIGITPEPFIYEAGWHRDTFERVIERQQIKADPFFIIVDDGGPIHPDIKRTEQLAALNIHVFYTDSKPFVNKKICGEEAWKFAQLTGSIFDI